MFTKERGGWGSQIACIWALLFLVGAHAAFASGHIYRVKDFGAKGDGHTLDTDAIQRTLDAAAAAGGGEIDFAPGLYITGSLFLHSHTHMVLRQGTTLFGTTDPKGYPRIATRAAGVEMQWPAALININHQVDVSIQGDGTIDGNGKLWWDAFWTKVPSYESRGLRWAVDYDVQRPELLLVYASKNVKIGGGLLLKRSAFWTVHICYSEYVVVDHVTIRDNDPVQGLGPSTDGVDIDSSRHVLVQKVDIENNDDGICLKAGMNADGLRVNRPTEDVIIRDSIIRAGISGIAIGSDTAGGFRNIRISGITILSGVRYGIYLKSTHTRGGWTDNVHMSRIMMNGVKAAIVVDINYFPAFSTPHIPDGIAQNLPPNLTAIPKYWSTLAAPVDPEKGIPHFHDVTMTDIRGTDVGTAFRISAYPNAPLQRFKLKNIDISAQHAGSIQDIEDWQFVNVQVRAQDRKPLTIKDARQVKGTVSLIE